MRERYKTGKGEGGIGSRPLLVGRQISPSIVVLHDHLYIYLLADVKNNTNTNY